MPEVIVEATNPYSEYSGRCVAYSFMAMLCFGITNYLIAVATGILDNSVEAYYAIGAEWKMLAIIWGVGGVPGILCYLIQWLRVGRMEMFWSHNPIDTPSITWGTKALTLIGGLGLGVSMSLMKKAFVFTSPADKGPVSAVLCSTIIVVSVYGHFVFRELLSKRHALLIGIVVCGVLISALGPGGSTKAEDQAAATGQEYHETLGFLFAILSMLAFASTTLLVRYSAIGKVSTWSAFSARLLSQTGMAVIVGYAFVKSDEGQDLPPLVLPSEVVALAVLAGITQVAGFFALNLALSYPYTSLVNVVVSANSIVVLGLNFAIDGLLPCPSQLIGMLVILFGLVTEVERQYPEASTSQLLGTGPVSELHLETRTVIYIVDGNVPVLFKLHGSSCLYPTIFGLNRTLGLSSLRFMISEPVVPFLARGADLMLPGVVIDHGGARLILAGESGHERYSMFSNRNILFD
ncbi:Eukaryotic translation initiation factor 2D [Perkinsus chesapeaki]|uniref:Eukaryotic translation initiation factor 2D n=1 Tax=Perkinsus chesapeaki TaxID=330153 RepID=A0A7J6LRD0_PERCH|nr:Eukaryotic translation initiation factor 2D [Perkinsus chesapeaki]